MKVSRLAFIDALRGLAASYVVLFHLALLPNPKLGLPEWLRLFVLNGGTGVVLFFVLSAFTMCLTMQRRRGQPGAIRYFYLRRFFRIAPLFYVLLLVTVVFDRAMFGQNHSIFEFVLSLVFGFNFFPEYISGIVRASWTIGVEMLFYLIFPIIFKFVDSLWKSIVFLCLSLILASFYTRWLPSMMDEPALLAQFNHMNIVHQLPVFAMGMCVYYIYIGVDLLSLYTKLIGGIMIVVGVLAYYLMMHGIVFQFGIGLYWQALIYSLLLLGVAFLNPIWIVNRFTQFLGKISYSVYLNHPVLVLLMLPIFHKIYQFPLGNGWLYIASVICLFSVLVPVSLFTFNYVEAKGIAYSRRFT